MQVKWIRSVLCALPNYACIKMREFEWCCFLLVSAMYAGSFVTHNEGHLFRCEGLPCTAPLPIWFVFGLIVFELIVICESNSSCDFWTRLMNKFLRIRRVYRWPSSIEQAMTLLCGIFVSFSLWYEYWRRGRGLPSLAREWLGKSWKKSILAFQHQSPEWDESFRLELKQWLHRSVDVRERAIVLRCCGKIFGKRPDEGCLLTKDGHNRQLVTLCQESYCGGVHRSTLTKRPPQRLYCSPPTEAGNRGERLHWNNRSSMTAMRGADNL